MNKKCNPNYFKVLFLMLFTAILLPLGAESGCLVDEEMGNTPVCIEDAMDGTFEAMLSGLNELPNPVTTTGTGMLSASLTGNVLTVSGTFSGLTSDFDANIAGGAHLHFGMAGMGGGIAFLLTTDVDDDLRGGTFSATDNTFTLTNDEVATLGGRGIYVNIHTADYGGGELRGQLVPAGADDYKAAYLLGVNEVPAVMTPASGALVLERTGNTITVTGGFSGLTGTIATDIAGGAHLHAGVAGRNGGVEIPLNLTIEDDMTSATLLAAENTFELTAEQALAFDNGGLYVNIHSNAVRSGELRGQVLDMSVTQFYSNPSGHQARPMAINTPGNGRLLMSLDTANNLVVSGSVNDLQGAVDLNIAGGAHIHDGLAGTSGPVAFALTITLNEDGTSGVWEPANNTFALTDEQVAGFYARRYYVNVHTLSEGSGEVRGQVMNLAKAYFGSNLSGLNASPVAVKTTGAGFLMYEGSFSSIVVTGTFADLDGDFAANVAGGSHIHTGDAASTGGIITSLNATVAADLRSGSYEAADNSFALDSARFATMMAGNYYFNLHSTLVNSGEIRGQILRDDDAFPETSEIIAPDEGITVTLTPSGSNLEDGRFFAAADPNNDLVVYTIEIAFLNDVAFDSPLACEKVGTDTSSNATIESIYETLINFGAGPGTTLPLRYRILASDGSVFSTGAARTITLIIGVDPPPCTITAGTMALASGGTEFTICAGDSISDAFSVVVADTAGVPGFTYIVADDTGMILDAPANQPFDFEGAGAGTCTLYAVSHTGNLTGAQAGQMVDDLGGCFALSNPVVVTRLAGEDCGENRLAINEVDRDGKVEIINLSLVDLNAGVFFFASNDQFFPVSGLPIECGNLFLKPGEQVTVDAAGIVTAAGDELGLLSRMMFTPVENLVSYVAWGERTSVFEQTAIDAGLWTAGTELGAPNSAVSVQRIDTMGNVYALGAPTPCDANTLTTRTTQPAADRVAVFPNPFADRLVLEVSGLRSGTTELQLLDINGRVVFTRQLNQIDGRIELPTHQLAAGTYLVRLANEAGVSVKRVVRR